MKQRRKFLIPAFFAAGLLSLYVSALIKTSGVLGKVINIPFGHCEKKGVIKGAEDMVLIPGTSKLVMSSDAWSPTQAPGSGALYFYDYKLGQLKEASVSLKPFAPFHPHGLDLVPDAKGSFRLNVISHRDETLTTIESFQPGKNDHLLWKKTFRDDLFQSANDLVFLSPKQFFVTSDHGGTNPLKHELEHLLFSPTGYVSFFDVSRATKVQSDIFFANGILVSPDHHFLLVAAMLGRSVSVYDIKERPVKKIKTILLDGAPDNLTWYGDKIYAAVHPNLVALKKMSRDRERRSPSRVIEISNWNTDKPTLKTVYENTGEEIAAASVALKISDDHMIIGSVFDDHILDCQ